MYLFATRSVTFNYSSILKTRIKEEFCQIAVASNVRETDPERGAAGEVGAADPEHGGGGLLSARPRPRQGVRAEPAEAAQVPARQPPAHTAAEVQGRVMIRKYIRYNENIIRARTPSRGR